MLKTFAVVVSKSMEVQAAEQAVEMDAFADFLEPQLRVHLQTPGVAGQFQIDTRKV